MVLETVTCAPHAHIEASADGAGYERMLGWAPTTRLGVVPRERSGIVLSGPSGPSGPSGEPGDGSLIAVELLTGDVEGGFRGWARRLC